jgi:EAL domain-containing protein (putative c-di-GMP-specific phosphodiesterase class I)
VAEESRLVVDLGAWVLREACRQAREWREQGIHGVTMSINLAPRDFLNAGLPVQLAEALRAISCRGTSTPDP